ncbi:MAG: TonB-dependent receptor [Massilia sp.]|nr:TonB-dependent receptor [Massilia sp.]
MQSAFNQQPKLRLSLIALACQLACLSLSANAQTAQEAAASAPKAEVVITGKKLGMGLMVTEDAPRTRSTITAEELEKQRPTGNAYQALEMMPSVNSYNYDSTGLFGGGMTMRGFNSDQIGATINGAPVNDSGNFAVFPQEYVDQENTCTEYVTQGSADIDAPQVGASGGNFGIVTCNPEDKQRVRVMQTIGQLNMHKTYLRYDTGLLLDGRAKAFISVSNAQTDKWKGPGMGKRDHVDVGVNYDWDRFNYVHATVLVNRSQNNNYLSMTLSDLNSKGYNYDFSPVFTGKLPPVNGTAQNEVISTPAYYNLAVNPFLNTVASATAKFRLTDNLDLKILPYYWYGFGTGGTVEQKVTENKLYNSATGKLNGATDINGDGDTLDTIIVDNGSITRTARPGVTTSLTYTIGDHQILGGFWLERARHEQTSPAVPVDANGLPSGLDYYQQTNQILRPDGRPYQFRDALTISSVRQVFAQDTIAMFGDKGQLDIGVRAPSITRSFTNYPNEGFNAASLVYYKMERTWSDVLPSVGFRYRITPDDQLYTSVTKNMKAPPNFILFPSNSNVTLVNGVPTLTSGVEKEISWDTEIGYRHQTKDLIASISAYNVDFRNRQATATDPATLLSVLTNVGKVRMRGIEAELGNTPINGWSIYSSLGYIQSETLSDLQVTSTDASKSLMFLPTTGKVYPLTPKLKANLSVEYQNGSAWARLKARATSKQQATLMNDEVVPGYTILDFDAGYTLPNFGMVKRPKLTLNVGNLLSRQARNPSSTGNLNAQGYTDSAGHVYAAKLPTYYLIAPRFASLTLSVDF